MAEQRKLFHDSILDAIAADIAAIGGVKKVAGMLWPNVSASSAEAKLRASLNPDQPHKLDVEEVLRIKLEASAAGSTATVDYEAKILRYRPEWLSPEDEHARLQRQFVESVAMLERIRREMQDNQQRVRAV